MYNFSVIFFLLKGLVTSDVRIKRNIDMQITILKNNLSYKGIRHSLCLPYAVNVRVQMLVHNVVNEQRFVSQMFH